MSTSTARLRPTMSFTPAPRTAAILRSEASRRGMSMSRLLDEAVEGLCVAFAEHIAPSTPATIADLETPSPARREEIRAAIRPTVRRTGGAR